MIYIDEDNVGQGEFFVPSFETDCFYKAKPAFYFGLNQEIGGLHAGEKGCAIENIYTEEGKTWMILRTRMEVHKYVKWTDTLTFKTWCQEGYRLYAPRFIETFDKKDGSRVFESGTWWVIMDMIKKRPCKPSVFEDRIPYGNKEKYYKSPEFPPFPSSDEYHGEILPEYDIKVNYYDTDYNRHVNNISYVNWALDVYPKEFLDSYEPYFMDAKWERQSYLTDKLTAITVGKTETSLTDENPELLTKILRKDENGEVESVFEMSSIWRRKL